MDEFLILAPITKVDPVVTESMGESAKGGIYILSTAEH